jgi:hypothetical protein
MVARWTVGLGPHVLERAFRSTGTRPSATLRNALSRLVLCSYQNGAQHRRTSCRRHWVAMCLRGASWRPAKRSAAGLHPFGQVFRAQRGRLRTRAEFLDLPLRAIRAVKCGALCDTGTSGRSIYCKDPIWSPASERSSVAITNSRLTPERQGAPNGASLASFLSSPLFLNAQRWASNRTLSKEEHDRLTRRR